MSPTSRSIIIRRGRPSIPTKAIHYLQLAGENALAAAAADDALHYFDTALSFEELEDERTKAELLLNRAEAYRVASDIPKSVEGWEAALPLFEALQDRDKVAHIYTALTQWLFLLARFEESLARRNVGLPLSETRRHQRNASCWRQRASRKPTVVMPRTARRVWPRPSPSRSR